MIIENKWFDIFLDALSFVPNAGPIVRKLDSIKNDLKFKDVKYEIEKIWNVIDKNPLLSLEGPVLKSLKLIENNELIPNFNFRKAESCMILLKEINIRSKNGKVNDPAIEYDECIRIIENIPDIEDTEKELRLVVHELKKKDLIHIQPIIGSPLRFYDISPKEHFFCKTDRLFQQWDPMQDAKEIVKLLVNREQDKVSIKELDDRLKWGIRRLNSALSYLDLNTLIMRSRVSGRSRYVFPWMRLTEEAYFFIEND